MPHENKHKAVHKPGCNIQPILNPCNGQTSQMVTEGIERGFSVNLKVKGDEDNVGRGPQYDGKIAVGCLKISSVLKQEGCRHDP